MSQILEPPLHEHRCTDLLGNTRGNADNVKKSQLVNKILSTSNRESPNTAVNVIFQNLGAEVSATPERPSETKVDMENIAGILITI